MGPTRTDTPLGHAVDVDGGPRAAGIVGPDGCPPPFGPETLDVRVPGGTFSPPYLPIHTRDDGLEVMAAAEPKKTWLDVVDESKVLCFKCRFAWIVLKHAPIQNLKPDGTPFMEREGTCMFPAQFAGGGPLPLDERFVTECNQFRPKET